MFATDLKTFIGVWRHVPPENLQILSTSEWLKMNFHDFSLTWAIFFPFSLANYSDTYIIL